MNWSTLQLHVFFFFKEDIESKKYLFGKEMHTQFVLTLLGPQFNLSQDLVGEGVTHHKTWMAVGTSQIDQTTLGQQDNMATILQCIPVNLWMKSKSLQFLFALLTINKLMPFACIPYCGKKFISFYL